MTGGMSGGHFAGFFLAILGLAVLVVVSTRPVVIRRLGTRRWPSVAFAILLLVLLAVFGSGSREIYFRTVVGPREGVLSRVTQAHVDVALQEISRPAFVQYLVRLEGAPPLDESDRIAGALAVRVGTTVDLQAEGYRFDPPPKIGQTWFFVSYADRENALLAIFRGDAGIRRMALSERLVTRVLPQASAIVALRVASTDDEKLAILRENPFVMPYAAEWIASELGKLMTKASPALQVQLEQKRAYVQQYVNNPGARDLPLTP
jgi:hypothetical protein